MSKKLKNVKAWCSGIAYAFPDRMDVDGFERMVRIFIGSTALASWKFKSKKEFWAAVKIVIGTMKKGR